MKTATFRQQNVQPQQQQQQQQQLRRRQHRRSTLLTVAAFTLLSKCQDVKQEATRRRRRRRKLNKNFHFSSWGIDNTSLSIYASNNCRNYFAKSPRTKFGKMVGQWSWLRWQSGRFCHQRSAVRIESSANFIVNFIIYQLSVI